MRARYYHPGLRRFVNPDPIGFEGGSNWYGYAGGNPLMANDPSGLVLINLFDPNEAAYTNVQSHPFANHPNILVIGGHGNNGGISDRGNTEMTGGRFLNTKQLYARVEADPNHTSWDDYMRTEFASCNVGNMTGHPSEQAHGNSPTSNPFARFWALLTGKPAVGADNFQWPSSDGTQFVGPPTDPTETDTSKWKPDYSKPGGFNRFEADGSSTRLGLTAFKSPGQKIKEFYQLIWGRRI